jgi:membrane-bound lytic murein transglycosylase D
MKDGVQKRETLPENGTTRDRSSQSQQYVSKKDRSHEKEHGKVIDPPPGTPEEAGMSNQELLDSALEFCQASNDFWEQGDLDNAIDALDKAYSLVLRVDGADDPEIIQQKEDLRFTISKRITEVYASRFTVANGLQGAIPLVMNRHVEQALKQLTGRERKFFLSAYRRSGLYRPSIVKALKEAGLPEELSWLPLIESGFKVRALSRARALGLWQFIASTGYKYGLSRDEWIDERMDPEKATQAAIAYLRELHQIFGDWTTALAAYNCGEGLVLKRIRTQKINYLDHFWDLYERLPSETACYVPRFLAVLHILKDPQSYGMALPPVDEEVEKEVVHITKQVHLKTVSRSIDADYKLLELLNAELRHNMTPKERYPLKVPSGKGAILLAKLSDIPVYKPPVTAKRTYIVHRVKRGESLSGIASRYRTSVRSIMAANGLKRKDYLKAGWRLKVPTGRGYTPSRGGSPVRASKLSKKSFKYKVKKGDSLWTIANQFNTTTNAIKSYNRLRGNTLRIGQVLTIPGAMSGPAPERTKHYTVRKGDTPYIIAKKHQMNLASFLKLNNLTPRSTIFPGQALLVMVD